jgi:hypothetical protein
MQYNASMELVTSSLMSANHHEQTCVFHDRIKKLKYIGRRVKMQQSGQETKQ